MLVVQNAKFSHAMTKVHDYYINSEVLKESLSEILGKTDKVKGRSKSAMALPAQNATQLQQVFKFRFAENLANLVSRENTSLPVELKALIELMAVTGLRVSEVLGIKANDVLSDGSISVRGLKGSNNRLVRSLLYSSYWINLSKNNSSIPKYYSRFYIYRILLDNNIYIFPPGGQKKSVTHALRYSYILHLLADRVAVDDIQLYIGHKNINSTIHYIKNIIAYADKKK